MDLAAPEMRTLIDMRFRPHLRSQSISRPRQRPLTVNSATLMES